MPNIYEMVFLSPIGTIGTRSYNDKISELRFIQNRPEIKPKNLINKELYVQLKFYFKKKAKKIRRTIFFVWKRLSERSFKRSYENSLWRNY